MPYRLGPLRRARQAEARDTGQLVVVARGQPAAMLVPGIEPWQLDAQEGRLHLVEPRIEAALQVHVFHPAAVVAQHAQPLGQLGIVGGDRAAVAEGAEILGRKETVRAGMAERAGPPSAHLGALRLRHVLDHFQPVLVGQRHDGVHVGRLAVEMDRHDRPGARRDRGGDPLGIDVDPAGRRLDRHHRGAHRRHREPGRDIGVGRHDHLVAGAEVPGAQHQLQRLQPVAQADAVRGAAEGGVLGLEGLDFLAEHEPARFHDAGIGGIELGLQLGIDRLHVEERDHASLAAASRLKTS